MKILITGGCGFLGSNLAASYLQDGIELVIIDKLLRTGGVENLAWLRGLASPKQLHFYPIDLADDEDVTEAFRVHAPFDYICHVAGQVAMTTSLSDPRRDFRTNALGTFNVLEATRQYSPDSLFVYASTNKVYGDLEALHYGETDSRYTLLDYPHGLDETVSLDFASPYGCSKGTADQYVRDWHRNFGIKTTVFRHSSIYGGRQFATFDQGWIGWFCQKAVEQSRGGAEFTIAGTGKQVRDILHADDIVRLYRGLYEHRDKVAGQIFNIGGGMENSLSLLELFDRLATMMSITTLRFVKSPVRKSDQRVFAADIRKIKEYTGWIPQINIEQGLTRNLQWVSNR